MKMDMNVKLDREIAMKQDRVAKGESRNLCKNFFRGYCERVLLDSLFNSCNTNVVTFHLNSSNYALVKRKRGHFEMVNNYIMTSCIKRL